MPDESAVRDTLRAVDNPEAGMNMPKVKTAPADPRPLLRLSLLLLGFVALFVGMGAGLTRMGWLMPEVAQNSTGLHGPLMICGFFGVVIALERAVALERADAVVRLLAYLSPLAAGIATGLALAGATTLAPWFYVAAAVMLLTTAVHSFWHQRALFTFTLLLGAVAWALGCMLWASGSLVVMVVPWWLAFLVLTVAGERLELSRVRPPSALATRVFAALLLAAAIGLLGASTRWGLPLFAATLLGLALWLLKQDIASVTVRDQGLARFISVCMISGDAWLAVGAGVALMAGGLMPGTQVYDSVLHAVLLGFVFSMVFGHAPIIFPAVLRVAVPYHPSFYLPLALLHLSLLMRLAGNVSGQYPWTRIGGVFNALALIVFILSTMVAVMRGKIKTAPSKSAS